MHSPSLTWRCSEVVAARETLSLHMRTETLLNRRQAVILRANFPRLSACDELAQRQENDHKDKQEQENWRDHQFE